jgi:hypothetical protein
MYIFGTIWCTQKGLVFGICFSIHGIIDEQLGYFLSTSSDMDLQGKLHWPIQMIHV